MLRPALIVGVYSACWLALDLVSSFFLVDSDVTVWSPQEGLNFVLLFVFGVRYWPALLLNIPLHATFISGPEISVWETAVFDTTEAVIYVGVTLLLVRVVGINKSLRHQRDVVWFVGVACLAAPLAVSLIAVSYLTAAGSLAEGNLANNILSWWAGDATGIAMMAPFLLIFLSRFSDLWDEAPEVEEEARMTLPSREELPEIAVQLLATGAAVLVAYSGFIVEDTLEYSYFAFLPLVWIAVRNGLVRTTFVIVLVNVAAVTLVGMQNVRDSGVTLQFSLMTLTIVGLLVGGVVTQRNQMADRMRHEAFHDALTGLPNRRLFMRRLEEAMRRSGADAEYSFAVLFLDLDSFEVVNTNRGRPFGDRLLEAVAGRMGSHLRQGDSLARFGGAEFAVLLDSIGSKQEAAGIAERLLEAFEEPYPVDQSLLYVSASMGIVLDGSHLEGSGWKAGKEPEDCIRDADLALRSAKANPQMNYMFFDEEVGRRAEERFWLETDLRRAIPEEQFEVEYQPIYSAGDKHPVGAEALVRWRHPELGRIPPDQFIPLAEETGLIVDLGHEVLLRACRQMSSWRAAGCSLSKVSVNVSPIQVEHPRFVEGVLEAIGESGIEAQCLQLEFTEYWRIDAPEVGEALRRLSEAGVSLVIDDFGTGYSSLTYLGNLPFSGLKIDRSFVQPLPEEPGGRNRTIVEAILALSEKMGLEVTAEGVETPAQLDYLHTQGCELVQGFLFGKPKPAEELSLGHGSTKEPR